MMRNNRQHIADVRVSVVELVLKVQNYILVPRGRASFGQHQASRPPTSFPGSSLYLEKVPWLRLVTCLLDFSRFQRCDSREGLES